MRYKRLVSLLMGVSLLGLGIFPLRPAGEQPEQFFTVTTNSNTDWMAGHWGVGVHYLPSMYDFTGNGGSVVWNEAVNSFDVEKFSDSAQSAGASWVLFTIGHGSGYYAAPNATLDRFSGYQPGERNATRDLIMDLANALNTRGLKLIIYLPSNAPHLDDKIAHGLGLTTKSEVNGNWNINYTFLQRWPQVIEEWSDRYGARVSGWWLDGFYVDNGFTPEMGQIYAAAARHGNSQAVIALNLGANNWPEAASPYQDFLAGEQGINLYPPTAGRWSIGQNNPTTAVQWFAFNLLSTDWITAGLAHSDEDAKEYMKTTLNHGGAITWNVYVSADGTIDQAELEQLNRIRPEN